MENEKRESTEGGPGEMGARYCIGGMLPMEE